MTGYKYRAVLLLSIVLATLLVAGCAGAHKEDQTLAEKLAKRNYEILEPIERIQDYRINGWSYVDDYHVVFQGGPSRYYLLTFNQRCINLRSAHTIAFSSTVGRVTRFDKVLVKDRTGLPTEQCLIKNMHRLRKVN